MKPSGTEAKSRDDRRAREREQRREEILNAAVQVFLHSGAALTMKQVAEAAELSKGAVYLYFENKEDLLLALTRRPLDEVVRLFAELEANAIDSGHTLLKELIEAHSDVIEAHHAEFRVAMSQMQQPLRPPPQSDARVHYLGQVTQVRQTYMRTIERGIDDGSFRSDLHPTAVVGALWAAIFGAGFCRINRVRFNVDREEALHLADPMPTLVQLLLKGLAPQALVLGAQEPTIGSTT